MIFIKAFIQMQIAKKLHTFELVCFEIIMRFSDERDPIPIQKWQND